jgi:hypothetical protein
VMVGVEEVVGEALLAVFAVHSISL